MSPAARSALRIGVAVLATGAAFALFTDDAPAPNPRAAATAAEADAGAPAMGPLSASAARAMAGTVPEFGPDGHVELGIHQMSEEERASALIIGHATPSEREYCDPVHWQKMNEPVIAEIAEREIVVDPALWDAKNTGGKLGLVRWASACLFEGREVTITDAATREQLARYSKESGFRPAS